MYITKEQVDKRSRNIVTINPIIREPRQGARNKTHEEKVLIGVLAKFDTQRNVAEAFGTSHQNVSLIARGLKNGNVLDEKLASDISKATPKTDQISTKALDVLMSALGVVETTIPNTKKATDASVVARNVASVFEKMKSAESAGGNGPRIQININAPNQKKESEFETLEV